MEALEIQTQQKRWEDKVQKTQKELETMHKKIDDLTKILAHRQHTVNPTSAQASGQQNSQRSSANNKKAPTSDKTQNDEDPTELERRGPTDGPATTATEHPIGTKPEETPTTGTKPIDNKSKNRTAALRE